MGKNSRSKQDQEQSLKPQMGSPSVGINSNVGMSPTMGESFSNHLLALTAEAITDGLPTAVTEEALVEGSGQPTEGFPEEPLTKGVSIGVGSLYPTSTGSKISAADAVAAKDISVLCL
jgi:hypothetical protein